MTQGIFDFQYEVEKRSGGMTGLAGLPPYLEFGYVMGLGAAIANRLKIRGGDQGWSDERVVMALILLNLAGGDGVSDLKALSGDELIWWYRKRCGKSEEAHSVMKEDLAGGKLPSCLFGANAAWWHIMILALNLNSAMKRLVLGKNWVSKRLKAIRFALINLPGRVLDHARSLIVGLTGGHPSNGILFEMRRRIFKLCESRLVSSHLDATAKGALT